MGIGTGVEQDRLRPFRLRLVQPVDQMPFVVRLAQVDFQPQFAGAILQHAGNIVERVRPVDFRLAQAQLVGWLEGLFQGIQATLFTQQMAAQGQFDEMRRRAIESGQAPPQAPPGSGYL